MSCSHKKKCDIKRLQNGGYSTPTLYSAQELYTRFSQCLVFIETDFELQTPNSASKIYTTQSTGFFFEGFLVAPASAMYLPSIPKYPFQYDPETQDVEMAIESSEFPVAIRVYTRLPKLPCPISAQIVALDAKSNLALLTIPGIDICKLRQFKHYKSKYQTESIYNTGQFIMYYYQTPKGMLETLKTSIPNGRTSLIDLDHPLITFTDLYQVPPHHYNVGTPIFNIYGWVTGMWDPTLHPQGSIDRQCFYTFFTKLAQGYLATSTLYLNVWSYIGVKFNTFQSTLEYLSIDESQNPDIPAPNRLISLQNPEKLTPINLTSIPGLFLFNTPPETFCGINERFAIQLSRVPYSQLVFGWSLDNIYYDNLTLRQLYLSLDPTVGPFLDSQVNLSRFA